MTMTTQTSTNEGTSERQTSYVARTKKKPGHFGFVPVLICSWSLLVCERGECTRMMQWMSPWHTLQQVFLWTTQSWYLFTPIYVAFPLLSYYYGSSAKCCTFCTLFVLIYCGKCRMYHTRMIPSYKKQPEQHTWDTKYILRGISYIRSTPYSVHCCTRYCRNIRCASYTV